MSICASAVNNSDGTQSIVLQPSQTNLSQCSYAVMTGSEAVNTGLLQLTPDDALTLLVPICVVWATAWAFKQISKMLGESEINYDL